MDADGDEPGSEQADAGDDIDRRSEAVRRQQLLVGSGVAALSGVAVTIAGLQQFPGVPAVAFFGAGMVTTALVYGLLYATVFRG